MDITLILIGFAVGALIGVMLAARFVKKPHTNLAMIVMALLVGGVSAAAAPTLIGSFMPGGPVETAQKLQNRFPYIRAYSTTYPDEYREMLADIHARLKDGEDETTVFKEVETTVLRKARSNARVATDITLDQHISHMRRLYEWLELNAPQECPRMQAADALYVDLSLLSPELAATQEEFIVVLLSTEAKTPQSTLSQETFNKIANELAFAAQSPRFDFDRAPARSDDAMACRVGAAFYGGLEDQEPRDRVSWYRSFLLK